jgi:O-antigen/teichoic acid export membrane protein
METPGVVPSQQGEENPVPQNSFSLEALPEVSADSGETRQFRSQVGHISRQSGIFFLGTLFTAALGYVFKVYLARALGAEALGLYALGITLVSFIGIFNTLGLAQSAVRYVAVYRAAEKFQQLHAVLWVGGGILLLASVLFAAVLLWVGPQVAVGFYHSPRLVHYLPLFAVMMLPSVLVGFYNKVLAGYMDLGRRTLIVSFLGVPLTMALAMILIARGGGLGGYLLAQILSTVVVLILLVMTVRSLTPAPARFLAQPWSGIAKEVWSFSAAMLGIGMMEFFIVQVDKISLGYFRGAREVGIYSVAAAVVAYVPLILHSINQIFAATIADLHTRGQHALLARLFQSLTKWVVSLTLPLAAVIIVFARPFMRIFGHDFEAGWPILVIGTMGQLINCGVGSVGYLLLMSGNQRRLIRVQAVMTVVMVVLNVLLIPVWGIVGAAVAAATTNVGINAWNLWEVRKALRISPYNRSYLHLMIPAAAMLAVTVVMKKSMALFHHEWIAIGCALGLAYVVFSAVAVGFGLDADDRLIARAIWARVRGVADKLPIGMES